MCVLWARSLGKGHLTSPPHTCEPLPPSPTAGAAWEVFSPPNPPHSPRAWGKRPEPGLALLLDEFR